MGLAYRINAEYGGLTGIGAVVHLGGRLAAWPVQDAVTPRVGAAVDADDHLLLEAIARSGIGVGPARVPKVAWSMDHHQGDTFRLTNTGDAKAWNVTVSSDETLHSLNVTRGPDLGEGEALTFMAAAHWGTRDRTASACYSTRPRPSRSTPSPWPSWTASPGPWWDWQT